MIDFERYGGRRFLLALGTLCTATAVLSLGKIDGSVWRDVMIGIVGIYVAGNTAQKIKGAPPAEEK